MAEAISTFAPGAEGGARDRRPHGPTALARRALALVPADGRAIVGVAGSPGSGKTTLARAVAERVNELAGVATALHLPMDGFHLANTTLDALGRHERKGVIDTFDGWGFVDLLGRVLTETGNVVYAPAFERTVDEPVAGSIPDSAGGTTGHRRRQLPADRSGPVVAHPGPPRRELVRSDP